MGVLAGVQPEAGPRYDRDTLLVTPPLPLPPAYFGCILVSVLVQLRDSTRWKRTDNKGRIKNNGLVFMM